MAGTGPQCDQAIRTVGGTSMMLVSPCRALPGPSLVSIGGDTEAHSRTRHRAILRGRTAATGLLLALLVACQSAAPVASPSRHATSPESSATASRGSPSATTV